MLPGRNVFLFQWPNFMVLWHANFDFPVLGILARIHFRFFFFVLVCVCILEDSIYVGKIITKIYFSLFGAFISSVIS